VAPVWTTPDDVQVICPDATDDEALEGPCAMASAILYALSGSRWPGPQTDVVRPCSPLSPLGYTSGAYGPAGASWTTWGPLAVPVPSGWCGCARVDLCGCASPSMVTLPGAPATSVERVTLDAVVLDPASYRLMGQLLTRAEGRWPCCQDWTVAGDQPGAFEVAYTWGAAPPPAGQAAASVLACELWRATPASGQTGACRLPKRVTTLSRQGVQLTMLDPMAMFPDGLTGIPEVDLWLSAERYGQVHRPSTVMVPGARPRHLRDTAVAP
jgi:hypothetical protein